MIDNFLYNQNIKKSKGFTLVELLLYLAAGASLVLLLSFWWSNLESSRLKDRTLRSLRFESERLTDFINFRLNEAQSINFPISGSSSAVLSLLVADISKNPTIISVTSNRLEIQEGATVPRIISVPELEFSNFNILNLSSTSSDLSLKLNFTATRIHSSSTLPAFDFHEDYSWSYNRLR